MRQMRMCKTLWRIRLATTHPESICTVLSLITRYAKCFMFSVCVQQKNRLSRPPIAVVYSPATTQTRPLPSGDHLFCHRPAEPVMAGFVIERQRNIYTEDGSNTSIRKVYLFTKLQAVTYRKEYSCFHPRWTKADFLWSTDTPPRRCTYQPSIYFLVKQNFMVTSSSTCQPHSGVWNQCNKLLASTHDTKTVSFALSEIRNKKLHCNCIIIIIIIIIQQIIAL
jgi:hypothetical protein